MNRDLLLEAFKFLDYLRESGATNMYGAGPYIEQRFLLEKRPARQVLMAWMGTFDGEASVEERAEKAAAR